MDRICAAHAARLYVTLLQLPGSGGGFKLYHPMLFQKALNVVYLYPEAGTRPPFYLCEGEGRVEGDSFLCPDGVFYVCPGYLVSCILNDTYYYDVKDIV